MIMTFLTPLLPWIILAGGALAAFFGYRKKVQMDATKDAKQKADVDRAVDVVKAVTQRANVDVSVGAASPAAVGDELRRQDRPERPV